MVIKRIIYFALLFVVGCISYKELQPIPEIIPAEGQVQSLKNREENFVLEKGDKYVIKFPRPSQNDFYLILMGYKKPIVYASLENYFDAETETVLTRSFGFKEGSVQKVKDETLRNDTLSIYSIDSMSSYYVWKIDTVRVDVELDMRYRYVFRWRYIFENDYERILSLYNNNMSDRTIYNSINLNYDVNKIELVKNIDLVKPRKSKLQEIRNELANIEKVFPKDIKLSADTAYTTYIELCNKIDEEIEFQNKYINLLVTLKEERDTKGDVRAFLNKAPDFAEFVSGMSNYPTPIAQKVRQIFMERLREVIPFYESLLKKSDVYAIGPYPELENAITLYNAFNFPVPMDCKYLIEFIQKFVEERDALKNAEYNLTDIDAIAENTTDYPTDSFYRTILHILGQTKSVIPISTALHVEKYGKYRCALILDQKIISIAKYVDILKEQVESTQSIDHYMREINTMFEKTPKWPSDSFYIKIVDYTEEMKRVTPKTAPQRVEPYSNSRISTWINRRIANSIKYVNEFQQKYEKASVIVPQINNLKRHDNYRSIIRLLNANRALSFLIAQYPDVDDLSLSNQIAVISKLIENRDWYAAEIKLEQLFNDKDFLNHSFIATKNKSVRQIENELFDKIEFLSRNRAEDYAKNNEAVFKDVQAMYKDSAFLPVYDMTFSSISEKDLIQKKMQLVNNLNEIRYIRFPESAIKTLYRELTKNIREFGVEKARAIVEHGKQYKGKDRQLKGLVDECDYSVAKIISKPSEYRKFYALPSTSNLKGVNEYIIKLNLKIPSEAEFPVFDVNLITPPEIVKNNPSHSWYDEITVNKKIIKSEGRFHITAPTALNNYEAQITPVQIDKNVNNILEIKFKYEGFRVFEFSVMAQKPIIRKN